MATLKQTADSARKLSALFQSTIDLIALVDKLGDLEQVEVELKARTAKARTEAERAEATLAKYQDAVAHADKTLAERKATFEAEAQAAASIHVQAIEAARRDADQILATANAQRDAIEAEIVGLNASALEMSGKIKVAAAELADLEAKLDKVKAAAAKLAGG